MHAHEVEHIPGFVAWLAGSGRYATLTQCMDGDYLWLGINAVASLCILAGYLLFAWRCHSIYRSVKEKSETAKAFMSLIVVFAFCAFCGYGIPAVRLFWPCYRLESILKVILLAFTMRLVIQSRNGDNFRDIFDDGEHD